MKRTQPLQVITLVALIASHSVFPQSHTTPLRPEILRNFIRPNEQVRLLTPNSNAAAPDSSSINTINIRRNATTVLGYGDRMTKLGQATLDGLRSRVDPDVDLSEAVVIPEAYVETDAEGNQRAYRILFTSLRPLVFDTTRLHFRSTIEIFLVEDRIGAMPLEDDQIDRPIDLRVTSSSLATFTPNTASLTQLFIPTEIEVTSKDETDTVEIKAITRWNTDGYTTYLKIEPTLHITAAPELEGLGVEQVPLTLSFMGSSSNDSVKVSFIGKGHFDPSQLHVKYNEPAVVKIRSRGLGPVTVKAIYSGNRNSNAIHLDYKFPVLFILSALFGGLIGGLAKYFRAKNKTIARTLLGSVLFGVIVTVSYWYLGLNLLQLEISPVYSEVAVFALSAVGAYFGVKTGEGTAESK